MAKIFCYTATGNSLFAAKTIAEKINAEVVPIKQGSVTCADDVIGFIFPVFFWGLPKPVENFIKNINIVNKNSYIFAVTTYGGFTLGELDIVKRILKRKGLHLNYGKRIKSVENYIPIYKINNNEKINNKAFAKITAVANKINNKKCNLVFRNPLGKISNFFNPGNKGGCDKNLNVSGNCKNCGICEKICPAHNIKLEGKNIIFMHNCAHCLACIHACPEKAINWKNKTQNKERYLNPKIKREELINLYK